MAQLKLSGMIDKISGKLGGSILGTSANGSFIKQNSFSQQPGSPAQLAQRNEIYKASTRWKNLTTVQKGEWEAMTVNYPYINNVGDTVYYTGYQLYLWCNAGSDLLNSGYKATPGTFVAMTMPTASLSNIGNISIINAFVGASANLQYVLYAAQPKNNGEIPMPIEYKKQLVNSLATGTSSFSTLYTAMYNMPAVAVGQYFWCYYRFIHSPTGATAGFSPILKRLRTS